MMRPAIKEDIEKIAVGRLAIPYLLMLRCAGMVLTVIYKDKPVALAIMNSVFPGVVELWSVLTDEVKSHPKLLHTSGLFVVEALDKNENVHRIQSLVERGDTTAYRWMERLGFEEEGLLKQYGPDRKDYHMFARVKPWHQ